MFILFQIFDAFSLSLSLGLSHSFAKALNFSPDFLSFSQNVIIVIIIINMFVFYHFLFGRGWLDGPKQSRFTRLLIPWPMIVENFKQQQQNEYE